MSQPVAEILGAVAEGRRPGGSALKALLGSVRLHPGQDALLQVLLELEQSDEAEIEELDEPTEARPGGGFDVEHSEGRYDAHEVDAELHDLRQANDALAAALGACATCWGGDDGCPDCAGHGLPGAEMPRRELFEELVVPAIERVLEGAREGRRTASTHRRNQRHGRRT